MVQQGLAAAMRIQGASSEEVRDISRRVLLNLIRTRHPVSRAGLARISGLQRSTISLIVEELLDGSWVMEGPTGRLPRGRRPTGDLVLTCNYWQERCAPTGCC